MKKKRLLCAVLAAAVFIITAISLTGCDRSADYAPNDYYISVSAGSELNAVECVTDIELKYVGERSDKLSLLMNSAAFTDKLLCETSDIAEAYPKGASYGKVNIKSAEVNGRSAEAAIEGNVLRLGGAFKKGRKYDVHLEYSLVLPYNTLRYGYNDYSLNLAQFYPQYAPIYDYDLNGDPFNNPPDNYKVDLEYPSNYRAAASGDLLASASEGGFVKASYEAKNCRDYAIVIARDYNEISGTAGGITVNYIYSTDKTPEPTLNAALKAIETFSEIFGKYERKTLHIAETDFLYGGMEYSGLITVANDTQADERERVAVHETAHQWWYDAVHSDQVLHAWQDEGLTEFSVYLYYAETGNAEAGEKLIWNAKSSVEAYRRAAAREGAALDERIDRPVSDFNNSAEYTFSTYIKGQLMFNYIYETLGRERFLAALKEYYRRNAWRRLTEPEALTEVFEKQLNGIGLIIEAWLSGRLYSL